MKILAVSLVVLGLVALVYGGIGYNRQRTVLQIGDMKATATEHHSFPLSPVVGVLALAGGVVLLVAQRRRA